MDGGYHPSLIRESTDSRLASGMPNPPPWNFLDHELSANSTFRPYQYDRAPGAFLPQHEPQYRPRAAQFGQLGAAPELSFQNTPYGLSRPDALQSYPATANTDVWKTKETYSDPNNRLLKLLQTCTDLREEIMGLKNGIKAEMHEMRNDIQEMKGEMQQVRRLSNQNSQNITNITNKVAEYMKFLSEWIKKFSEKVDPIIAKFAADMQQSNTRDTQHVGLGGNMEDEAGFGFFNA